MDVRLARLVDDVPKNFRKEAETRIRGWLAHFPDTSHADLLMHVRVFDGRVVWPNGKIFDPSGRHQSSEHRRAVQRLFGAGPDGLRGEALGFDDAAMRRLAKEFPELIVAPRWVLTDLTEPFLVRPAPELLAEVPEAERIRIGKDTVSLRTGDMYDSRGRRVRTTRFERMLLTMVAHAYPDFVSLAAMGIRDKTLTQLRPIEFRPHFGWRLRLSGSDHPIPRRKREIDARDAAEIEANLASIGGAAEIEIRGWLAMVHASARSAVLSQLIRLGDFWVHPGGEIFGLQPSGLRLAWRNRLRELIDAGSDGVPEREKGLLGQEPGPLIKMFQGLVQHRDWSLNSSRPPPVFVEAEALFDAVPESHRIGVEGWGIDRRTGHLFDDRGRRVETTPMDRFIFAILASHAPEAVPVSLMGIDLRDLMDLRERFAVVELVHGAGWRLSTAAPDELEALEAVSSEKHDADTSAEDWVHAGPYAIHSEGWVHELPSGQRVRFEGADVPPEDVRTLLRVLVEAAQNDEGTYTSLMSYAWAEKAVRAAKAAFPFLIHGDARRGYRLGIARLSPDQLAVEVPPHLSRVDAATRVIGDFAVVSEGPLEGCVYRRGDGRLVPMTAVERVVTAALVGTEMGRVQGEAIAFVSEWSSPSQASSRDAAVFFRQVSRVDLPQLEWRRRPLSVPPEWPLQRWLDADAAAPDVLGKLSEEELGSFRLFGTNVWVSVSNVPYLRGEDGVLRKYPLSDFDGVVFQALVDAYPHATIWPELGLGRVARVDFVHRHPRLELEAVQRGGIRLREAWGQFDVTAGRDGEYEVGTFGIVRRTGEDHPLSLTPTMRAFVRDLRSIGKDESISFRDKYGGTYAYQLIPKLHTLAPGLIGEVQMPRSAASRFPPRGAVLLNRRRREIGE